MATPKHMKDYEGLLSQLEKPVNVLSFRDLISSPRAGLPKLKPWYVRLWCAMRGHGGNTPFPGDTFYMRDALCKRCGSRVLIH